MLDGLAFLPLEDVSKGITYLKGIMPEEAAELFSYFDSTYVTGTTKKVGKAKFKNIPPRYPPSTWNVYLTTLGEGDRTNNSTEGWNHRFGNIVGQTHPSPWTLIEKIRLEVAVDEIKLLQRQNGRKGVKRKRTAVENRQNILKTLCEDYETKSISIDNHLKAIANAIKF
jgi:hypothetical protein